MCKVVLSVVVAVLCLFACGAEAQNQLISCSAAQSLNFNQSIYFGYWLEVARQPSVNAGCIDMTVALMHDNVTLSVNVSKSESPSELYANQKDRALIPLTPNGLQGYNVSFVQSDKSVEYVWIKLLQQYNTSDGIEWMMGCGYTDVNNAATSYGFLLARNGYNASQILEVNNIAAGKFSNFQTANITSINHRGCYQSSASKSVPVLSAFLAVFYMLLKSI